MVLVRWYEFNLNWKKENFKFKKFEKFKVSQVSNFYHSNINLFNILLPSPSSHSIGPIDIWSLTNHPNWSSIDHPLISISPIAIKTRKPTLLIKQSSMEFINWVYSLSIVRSNPPKQPSKATLPYNNSLYPASTNVINITVFVNLIWITGGHSPPLPASSPWTQQLQTSQLSTTNSYLHYCTPFHLSCQSVPFHIFESLPYWYW